MTRFGWSVGAIALAASWSAIAAAQGGWAVRICRGQTEAAAMKIAVGDGKTSQQLVNWRSDNQQTSFAVPASLATAGTLTVSIDSEPADGQVAACVMWKDAPAKAMQFTDQLSVTVAQADKDDSCPCK